MIAYCSMYPKCSFSGTREQLEQHVCPCENDDLFDTTPSVYPFPNGYTVEIENGVIALYKNGNQVTNSNIDYYYANDGYNLKSELDVAIKYYENFRQ